MSSGSPARFIGDLASDGLHWFSHRRGRRVNDFQEGTRADLEKLNWIRSKDGGRMAYQV